MGSMCARIGGVLAPLMYLLRRISPQAPMVLCGLCPLLGSALTLLLPETANKPLPDTIEDVEGSNLSAEDGGVRPVVSEENRQNGLMNSSRVSCHFS
ncbi:organic cation transporter protein-like [Sander vitreus]